MPNPEPLKSPNKSFSDGWHEVWSHRTSIIAILCVIAILLHLTFRFALHLSPLWSSMPLFATLTIFISTHFMNEAMRCDRISLMHAGKVLVQAEPKAIAKVFGGGAHGLEEAFIHHIEEATSETIAVAKTVGASDESGHRSPSSWARNSRFAGLTRLLAFSDRETMEVILLCMITIIPMMMLSGGMSPLESQP